MGKNFRRIKSYTQVVACFISWLRYNVDIPEMVVNMTEIQKIIKRIERQVRYALAEDEADSAGKDWADGYNFALSGVRAELEKLKQEYENRE